MADFEIITASSSDLQMLTRSASGGGWAGMLRNSYSNGSPQLDNIAERGSYSAVSAVYGCVRARANAMAMLPLRVGTNQNEILDSGPLVDLTERPGKSMNSRQFWRTTESHLSLFGRAHWWIELLPNNIPVRIVPLNPLLLTPKLDAMTGELQAWMYKPAASGRVMMLTPNEIHSIIDPDFETPDQLFDGLSPRRAAARAISQYHKADWANEVSLDHGVSPDGILGRVSRLPHDA